MEEERRKVERPAAAADEPRVDGQGDAWGKTRAQRGVVKGGGERTSAEVGVGAEAVRSKRDGWPRSGARERRTPRGGGLARLTRLTL